MVEDDDDGDGGDEKNDGLMVTLMAEMQRTVDITKITGLRSVYGHVPPLTFITYFVRIHSLTLKKIRAVINYQPIEGHFQELPLNGHCETGDCIIAHRPSRATACNIRLLNVLIHPQLRLSTCADRVCRTLMKPPRRA